MKKRISMLLILTLVISMITSIPFVSFAADTSYSDLNNVKKVCYGSFDNLSTDYYNDDLFTTDPSVYNPHLAIMSVIAASATCSTFRQTGAGDKYMNSPKSITDYFEDSGFSDIYANDAYKVKPDGIGAPTVCAHKKIIDNGKEYTLLAVFPRGGGMGAEFNTIAKASRSGDDKGNYAAFDDLKEKTLQAARNYINDYGIKGDLKVWIVGYSRGGGIANLVAGDIVDDPAAALGSSVRVENSNIYCYTFSPFRSAVNTRDLNADRYDVIHNIISDSDLVLKLPNELMGFAWCGQVYDMRDGVSKADAMRLLKLYSEKYYQDYISGEGPESFSPMKLDIAALLRGKLSITADEDSYLPYDQGEFLNSMMNPLVSLFNEEGGDVRTEYYNKYQEPLSDLISYQRTYGLPDANIILKSKTAVPFVLSAYISFLADKNAGNSRARNAEINAATESAFNALAAKIEDEDGNLRKDVAKLKTTDAVYKMLRRMYFSENADPETDLNGIPQKYSLRRGITVDEDFAKYIRKINARLYTITLKEVLNAQGVDSALISSMTSEKAGTVMSHFLAHAMFGNECQSSEIRPLDPNNEQFKNLATLIGNYKSCATLHYVEYGQAWVEAKCDLYSDYEGIPDDQLCGYRRVYIHQPEGVDVVGTVRNEDGSVSAVFKNGQMLSRADDWIGYTKSDNGGWLRLPLNNSYTVELTVGKDTKLDISLAEHSLYEGENVRTVSSDGKYDWTSLNAYKDGTVSLNVPAVPEGEDGYALPSAAEYSISVSGGPGSDTKYSSSVPKIKNVSLKAGKKSLTVSWKKHSAKQRAKFSRTEIQYSTYKNFRKYKSVSVSKTKASYKIKGLKRDTKYYVRVRNVKKKSAVKYVSKWSALKKAKVK